MNVATPPSVISFDFRTFADVHFIRLCAMIFDSFVKPYRESEKQNRVIILLLPLGLGN